MAAKYIAVAQLKGGVGKSTLCINLADFLLNDSRVAIIDADIPQGTCMSWTALRNDASHADKKLDTYPASNADELISIAENCYDEYDYVIIDLPPRLADISRTALGFANIVLVPVTPSMPDVWAIQDMLPIIHEAKEKIDNFFCRMIWTKYKTTKENEDTRLNTLKITGLDELDTRIDSRVSYVKAMSKGESVMQSSDYKAKTEMRSLVYEIKELLSKD